MSYHFKSSREDRRKSQKLWTKLGLGGAFFILAIVFLLVFPRFSGNAISGAGYPFRKAGEILSGATRNFSGLFSSRVKLSKENNALKEQLLALNYKVADRDALAIQNAELRALHGRPDDKGAILSVVLEKPPMSPYDTFTLDVGEKQGVKTGDQVQIGEGLIIGKIIEAFPSRSRASLYSTSGEKFQAILGKNHVSVEVLGKGGGNFSIHLPRAVPVSVGDAVLAPSISPKTFGEIAKIDSSPNDSFQTLYFNSPVNMNELHYVKVVFSHE